IVEKIIDDIVSWLQQQVKSAGVNGLLVGVSGGLDSAVVAHLIKRAFPDDSLGVILPLKSNSEGMEHTHHVLESGNLQGMTVDLTKTHEVMFGQIQDVRSEERRVGKERR